jgi:hypothetical protein
MRPRVLRSLLNGAWSGQREPAHIFAIAGAPTQSLAGQVGEGIKVEAIAHASRVGEDDGGLAGREIGLVRQRPCEGPQRRRASHGRDGAPMSHSLLIVFSDDAQQNASNVLVAVRCRHVSVRLWRPVNARTPHALIRGAVTRSSEIALCDVRLGRSKHSMGRAIVQNPRRLQLMTSSQWKVATHRASTQQLRGSQARRWPPRLEDGLQILISLLGGKAHCSRLGSTSVVHQGLRIFLWDAP